MQAQAQTDRVPLKFSKSAPPYTKDEVAWFPKPQATSIQDRGYGLIIEPKDIPKAEPPPPEEARVRVQFLRSAAPYTIDEKATLSKVVADRLVREGVARLAPLSAAEVAEIEKGNKEREAMAARPAAYAKKVGDLTIDTLHEMIASAVKAALEKRGK